MKNLFKRSIAFVLVACMLLSVIPASVFAVSTNTYTYSWALPEGITATNVRPSTAGLTYGDFVDWARTGASFKQFANCAQFMTFNNSAGQAYISFMFTVENSGYYNIAINIETPLEGQVINAYVVPAAEIAKANNNSVNNTYIAALTNPLVMTHASTSTASKTMEGKLLYEGDYVIIFSAASSTGSHRKFYGLDLTKTGEAPADATYAFTDEKFQSAEWLAMSSNKNLVNGALNAAIEAEYAAGGMSWMFETGYFVDTNGNGAPDGDILHIGDGTNDYLRIRAQATRDDSTDDPWVAFRLAGVDASARYNVTLNTLTDANNTSDADIFLIPASVIADAVAEGATKEEAIAAAIATDTYKRNSDPVGFKASETAKKLGDIYLAAGEEFLLVLRANAPRAGSHYTDSNAWMLITGLDLHKWSDAKTAAVVTAQIDAIGNVTVASEPAILAARAAYDRLSAEQKLLVTNYQTLVDAEAALEEEKTNDPVANQAAADVVIALIATIDAQVSLGSEDAIVEARAAYDALTERQKLLVNNYDVLTAAEDALKVLRDREAANAVIGAIDAIGDVSVEDEAAINEARTLYNALTDDQKLLVTNYETLTDAEAALAALLKQAAVDNVIAKIDAIGDVTLNSADAISAARTAYNALSAEQKDAVTNYQTLIDAEFMLKDLRNPNPDPSNFDGYVYDFTDMVDVIGAADGSATGLYNATVQDKLQEAYENGDLPYNYYASMASSAADASTSAAQLWNNYYRYPGYVTVNVGGYAGAWFAMTFKAPASGSFKLQFTFPNNINANFSSLAEAYVLPLSQVEAALAADANATRASVINGLLVGNSLTAISSKNIKGGTAGIWGQVELTEDEEYIIVFRATKNKNGGTDPAITDQNVWLMIAGFNLTNPPSADDMAKAEEVMEQISAIGTVIRSSKDKIEAARAAYDALTDKQKELVENLAILETAEARIAELLDPANPIEYIYFDPGYPKNNGYPTSIGLTYGDFIDHAKNGSFKPYATYLQTQSSFSKGKWYGLKFTVDNAGDYNMTLNATNVDGNDVALDIYFVRAEDLIQGSGNTKNQAFVDALASSGYKRHAVVLSNAETLNLSGVQLEAGEYVIVMINTSESKMFNFSGFNIFRTGDYTGPEKVIEQPLPDPNTDKLVYDFYYDGTPNGTKILNSAILEVMTKEYALNKLNWKPVVDKLNTVFNAPYSSAFQDGTDTKRYPWKGIASSTTVGEWMAVQIKAPGTGTYDLILEHAKNVNGASVSSTYVIPVSALKDLSVESIDAAIANDTYKLMGSVSYKGSGSGHVTEMGQVDFEKGKDYVVVFKAATNKHGTTNIYETNSTTGKKEMYEGFLLPQKLTVSKFVPPAPLDQKEVVYNFHRTDMGESSSIFSEKNMGTMATEYIKGTSPWKPFATNLGSALDSYKGNAVYLNGTAKSYKFEAIMVSSLPSEWVAFQIKSPGAGRFNLALTYGINTNCTNKAEIHVIPMDKLSGSDEVKAVEAAVASGEYKMQRDVNMKKNYGTDPKYSGGNYGQVVCEIGQEFIVVFKPTTNKHGGTAVEQVDKDTGAKSAYQGFMILKEMKLTKTDKIEIFDEPEEVVPDITGQADPEAAAAVIALINEIDKTITLNSSAAIQIARTRYDLLTGTQKALVTNYQKLVDAEAKLAELVSADDKVKADAVIEKIDAIGEVTLESESKIVDARIAYTLLTSQQRALVTNYSKLLAAEARLDELKGLSNISPVDQASADAVETLISRIGTVTLDSEVYISAARNAYNALTDTQKLLVENYADLVAAEKTFGELKAAQDADAAAKDAAKRKAQQIAIMVLSAVIAVGAAGTVAIFAVPGLKEKVTALIKKK